MAVNKEQLKEIISKEPELKDKIENAKDFDELCNLLKPYNINSDDLKVLVENEIEKGQGKINLSADDLDNVSGGSSGSALGELFGGIAKGILLAKWLSK